ncbi:MAG: DUF4126 domain-containing protein [Sphingomonadales bacterium]
MSAVELIGLAATLSLLAGWRLYFCVFATGFAMQLGWIELPQHLDGLAVLANPWVIGAAAIGLVAEFLADKLPWVDSAWDAVHSFVRPVGGALLALAIVDPGDPAWQVVALLMGGGAALFAHGAKAGARAVVNTSPEPFSNVAVSTLEDILTGGLLALAFAFPVAGIVIALLLLALVAALLVLLRRLVLRLSRRRQPAGDGHSPAG